MNMKRIKGLETYMMENEKRKIKKRWWKREIGRKNREEYKGSNGREESNDEYENNKKIDNWRERERR